MFNKINKKLFFVLFIIIFIFAITSSYITRKKMEVSCINIMLYSTSDKMDLLEYLKKENVEDYFIKKKITVMILKDISYLAYVNPKIDELKGTPLKALYRVLKYNNEYGFDDGKDKLVAELFASIKPYIQKKSMIITEEYENSVNHGK